MDEQSTAVTYPECGAPATYQKTEGDLDWYMCPKGHQFYKRAGQ